MESGRIMGGLANSRWKKGKRVTALFVCDLSCIILNYKLAKDATVARLGRCVLLLYLLGLADGSFHACLFVPETNVVLL